MTTISNSSYFSGTRFYPVHTAGETRPLPIMVPTIWAVRADRSEVVACANLASARVIAEGRAPNKVDVKSETAVNVQAFVSPSGQYYVQHGNQRMDVANASTARHYVKHGVAISTMLAASLSSLSQ